MAIPSSFPPFYFRRKQFYPVEKIVMSYPIGGYSGPIKLPQIDLKTIADDLNRKTIGDIKNIVASKNSRLERDLYELDGVVTRLKRSWGFRGSRPLLESRRNLMNKGLLSNITLEKLDPEEIEYLSRSQNPKIRQTLLEYLSRSHSNPENMTYKDFINHHRLRYIAHGYSTKDALKLALAKGKLMHLNAYLDDGIPNIIGVRKDGSVDITDFYPKGTNLSYKTAYTDFMTPESEISKEVLDVFKPRHRFFANERKRYYAVSPLMVEYSAL